MRFTKTGPIIPDELLEAQKKGELLFFCGAGVSVPAGLPNFSDLTKNVAEKLHALDDEKNEISQLLSNSQFDRTFTALKRTYGDEVVYSVLLNELKLTRKPLLTNHENLLKLSINEEKKPFIITTNFDLLFEKVDKKIKSFVPPYLPDLQSKDALSGIVYLHGKWIDLKKNEPNNLIISSQDFGSAYLSHGWATRFLSSLLTRRTVVLIGYSGEDLLVRYLLEGLNTEKSASKNKIYAFERGEQGKIDQKWSQLGAVGISYPNHGDLWETIGEWAKYAGDDDKWNEHIFALSQKSPKDLEAFERGQVANFISTLKGAQKFQLFDPLPRAEWIYVFDKNIRLGNPRNLEQEDGQSYIFDPIEYYGIDTDPRRTELELVPDHLKSDVGEDFIDNITIEDSSHLRERISNLKFTKLWKVNSRVTSLLRWFAKVIEQPAGVWWVYNQHNLHPLMIHEIEERISKESEFFSETKLSFFEKVILSNKLLVRQPVKTWFELKFLIEKNNNIFTDSNLKDLESLLEPTLIVDSNFSYISYLSTEEDKSLKIGFKIEFVGFDHNHIEVHESSLISVINILVVSLTKYIGLLQYTSLTAGSFHSFGYPVVTLKNLDEEIQYNYENIEKIIIWLSHLINRQLQIDEKAIHHLYMEWPKDDSFIFNRLKLFVWINSQNVRELGIGGDIENFSDDLFWSTVLESDLFQFISKQWDKLPEQERIKVENKIIQYYPNSGYFDKDKFEQSKIYHTGRLLNEIENTEIGLSECSKQYFLEIKSSEKWSDSFLDEEPFIPGVMTGLVETNTSTNLSELELIADSTQLFDEIKIIENDRSEVLSRNRPFIGLFHKDIPHVLNLLLKELELGNLREEYWLQLFENAPDTATNDENLLIAQAILQLPQDIIFTCRFCLTRWIYEKLVGSCISHQQLFWQVWDYVFNSLNMIGPDATKSSLGEVRQGGKVIKQSRKTLEHALYSPIGKLVHSIFITFNTWSLNSKKCKKEFLTRFDLALKSKGEGVAHAAVMISYNFNFIFYHYKRWAELSLLPLLDIENPLSEAIWHGIMFNTPSKKASLIIKPYITSLFENKPEWINSEELKNNLVTYIIILSYWSYPKMKYYTDMDLRNLIRNFDENMLSRALWMLNDIIKKEKNWTTFGRHFFQNIWPKEISFQSLMVSERLLNLILETSDHFIDVNDQVSTFLGKINASSLFLFRLVKDDKVFLLEKYPEKILLLLDKVIGSRIEHYDHYLKEILDKLVLVKPGIKNHPSWRRLKDIAR
ncbi:SIR2 family protein [Acinetobacter gerneri]|uniref:SIR2 family protein n=1 Tax=Acinetobacter gerneri TaxID=202952 RepID=UPI003A8BB715